MILYVIRHPEPIDSNGICYGQTDLDVSDEILAHTATYIKELLGDKPVDLWLSSPLQRCSKLAAELSINHPDGYQTDNRLLEMNFGIWEGQRWDEIDRKAFDEWSANYVEIPAPGGESFGAVAERVTDLLNELREADHEHVAIVAHAGVIRALLSETLSVPLESTWHFSVNFGAVLEFRLGQEQWRDRLLTMSAGA